MFGIPMGVQLFSVREACREDLPGTLRSIGEMGYDGVEFAGYYDYSAEELRKMLGDAGLKCCGTHISLNSLLWDELDKTVDFNLELSNKYLIVPSLPKEMRQSKDGWYKAAEQFNEVAGKIRDKGLLCGYHNHDIEFKELDGEIPWYILLNNTDEDVVLQLDTGNAFHGGIDPVELLRKCAGRAVTLHLKEFSSSNDKTLIGEGDTDWGKVFDLVEGAGNTEWYIVEQESYACEPMECIARCRNNLRDMGK